LWPRRIVPSIELAAHVFRAFGSLWTGLRALMMKHILEHICTQHYIAHPDLEPVIIMHVGFRGTENAMRSRIKIVTMLLMMAPREKKGQKKRCEKLDVGGKI
jgi:hypothetical protein